MLEKAIEANREALKIWGQAVSAYEDTTVTRDGKLDEDATREERERAKPAQKSSDDALEKINELNDELQRLPDGSTTTSVTNPDGSRTVTTTDKDGNILSREKIR
jgi:hypothetical protein